MKHTDLSAFMLALQAWPSSLPFMLALHACPACLPFTLALHACPIYRLAEAGGVQNCTHAALPPYLPFMLAICAGLNEACERQKHGLLCPNAFDTCL